MHAGEFGEADVAGDADFLADGGDAGQAERVADFALVHAAFAAEFLHFAMAGEGDVELAGVFHGTTENLRIIDGETVVGEHHGSGGLHAGDAREFLAFAAFGDRSCGVNAGADAGAAGAFEHAAHDARVVDGGRGVWHHDEAGDASIDGRLGAGGDVFFVLLAGFAGMDVDVEEAGKQDAAGAVDDLTIADAYDFRSHADDFISLDEHVGGLKLRRVFAGDLGVAVEAFHRWRHDVTQVWRGKRASCIPTGCTLGKRCGSSVFQGAATPGYLFDPSGIVDHFFRT